MCTMIYQRLWHSGCMGYKHVDVSDVQLTNQHSVAFHMQGFIHAEAQLDSFQQQINNADSRIQGVLGARDQCWLLNRNCHVISETAIIPLKEFTTATGSSPHTVHSPRVVVPLGRSSMAFKVCLGPWDVILTPCGIHVLVISAMFRLFTFVTAFVILDHSLFPIFPLLNSTLRPGRPPYFRLRCPNVSVRL